MKYHLLPSIHIWRIPTGKEYIIFGTASINWITNKITCTSPVIWSIPYT